MFKTALNAGEIIVNNPSIWRPILSIEDAISGYIRAIESAPGINGIFNLSSGNYTVGEVADVVKESVESKLNKRVKLNIKNIKDFRNYKVSNEKAITTLSFKPKHDIAAIVSNLIANVDKFKDFDNPKYYNIQVFKKIEE
jgi:nucleoside-diphosphate-sugar epimerase